MTALTYHRMLAQIPLDNAATLIRRAVARPGAGHAGFTEIWVDDDHKKLTVYWHGPVPADISRLFTSLRSRMRIGIQVAAARYSSAQLEAAVSRVMRGTPGARVTGAGPLPDGSGIQVDFAGPVPAMPASQLFGVAVPVHATGSRTAQSQACFENSNDTLAPPARCNDRSPEFWGGAVINQIIGGNVNLECSTGFGVHSTVDSRIYMLTAGHCGNVNDTFDNGNLSEKVGVMTHKDTTSPPHDDAMIETSSGNRYYDGPDIFDGDTQNTKAVAGQQPSNVHDFLCESGAFGGVVCNLQITALNQMRTYTDDATKQLITVFPVAIVAKGTGGRGSGFTEPGDSGGPWFSLAANNKVTAKGIHLGLDSDPKTKKPVDMFFMTIDHVSQDFKVAVNTG